MPRLMIDGTQIHPNPKGVGRYALQVCSRLGDLLPEDWPIDLLMEHTRTLAFEKNTRLNIVPVQYRSEIHKAFLVLPREARRLKPHLLLKMDESVGRVAGLPMVAVCHDIHELIEAAQGREISASRKPVNVFKEWLRGRMLRHCEYVLCNSEFIRNAVQSQYGISPDRARIAYCAVDERFYEFSEATDRDAVRRKYGVPRFVLTFATGDPRENSSSYAKIAAHLAADKVDTCLLVAGVIANAPYGGRLKQEFVRHGLIEGRHFVFEEFLGAARFRELAELYTAADYYLELSLHEGFGMQLVEAMACGTTCISSPNGALREIGDRYALFVDPTDPKAVAQVIKKAYADGQEHRDNRIQVQYTHKFNWDVTAKVVAQTLLDVASRGAKVA